MAPNVGVPSGPRQSHCRFQPSLPNHSKLSDNEELGLLKPAAHVSGANRRYDDEDVERLQLIKRLRDVVGLSLADVRVFLETEDERRAVSREYHSTHDPARRAELLDGVVPILRRRVELLESKLETVLSLLEEERTRLDRVEALRA